MKKRTTICAALFICLLAVSPALAQMGHHGGMEKEKGGPHGMMMQHGECMKMAGGGCPKCPKGMGGMGMGDGMGMHGKSDSMMPMHGMMQGMMKGMAPSFYLDMKDRLGLEQQQIEKLRDIRQEFRKDYIRQSAEMKIAGMDLMDAFQGDWSVEESEQQLRQMMKQRVDLVVRYLKARKQAEEVLTEEQLQMVRAMMEQ